MEVTVETVVKAPLDRVWNAGNSPADIQRWNHASGDWRTTQCSVDLREGGRFSVDPVVRALVASTTPLRSPVQLSGLHVGH